jgi:hypothetical protein
VPWRRTLQRPFTCAMDSGLEYDKCGDTAQGLTCTPTLSSWSEWEASLTLHLAHCAKQFNIQIAKYGGASCQRPRLTYKFQWGPSFV